MLTTVTSKPSYSRGPGLPVHGVGKVDGRISSDVLDELHAAIKVCVNAEDQSPVGDGLHELRQGDLVCRQEHNGGDASSSTVG